LSRERKGARKHLDINDFVGVYEPDLDALQFSKNRIDWPTESQLVCDADPEALPRYSKCLVDKAKRFMRETVAVESEQAILKLAEREAASKPYYCKHRSGAKCEMSFDETYDDLCYEFACNDLNAPCPIPGVKMTPGEDRQKRQAMQTYMVSYLGRPGLYEEYQPSVSSCQGDCRGDSAYGSVQKIKALVHVGVRTAAQDTPS